MPILDGLGSCSTGYLTGGLGRCLVDRFRKKISAIVNVRSKSEKDTNITTKKSNTSSIKTKNQIKTNLKTKSNENENKLLTIIKGDTNV